METMKNVTLEIKGMHCGSCVARVDRGLRALAGVESVKIDLKTGHSEIVCDLDVSDQALREVVEEQGYTVTALSA